MLYVHILVLDKCDLDEPAFRYLVFFLLFLCLVRRFPKSILSPQIRTDTV